MNKRPFSLTANLEFLYISDKHGRVFQETVSAIKRRDGLICITGEPGTGKTIICRRLLEELSEEYNVTLVNTPPKTPQAMTETLDDAFGEMEGNCKTPVAVFDEAQHLDFRCLDHVKFLTNLEKDGEKLLQIILVGQPELAEKMNHKRFYQLEQRVGAKLRMGPLKKNEVLAYLTHRLSVAGLSEVIHFTRPSAVCLYHQTSGVPRLVNRIANLAVEQAVQKNKGRIGIAEVKRAASKVSASRDNWIAAEKPYFLSIRLSILVFLFLSSVALFLYYDPEWRFSLPGKLIWETRSVPSSSQIAVKVGTFFVKEEAEELRDRLQEQGFPSIIVEKELGEGWTLYQVRLSGLYTKEEATNEMDMLRTIGVHSIDTVQVKP